MSAYKRVKPELIFAFKYLRYMGFSCTKVALLTGSKHRTVCWQTTMNVTIDVFNPEHQELYMEKAKAIVYDTKKQLIEEGIWPKVDA